MRRSNKGAASQPREQSRGNFTPPPRAAAGSPELAGRPGGGGSRFAVRNWRVATRLNAILLIPVLVALVFGGLRVQDSVSTWNEAQDAQRTAELVQAAADYSNALIDERDRTAKPLLAGHRHDPVVTRARAATDRAKAAFDRAAERMPDKPGLERRLKIFRKQEPKLHSLRAAAYTSRLGGTKTEEGYVTIQHPLMEFANELGFGTGNVTSYGRTVYSVSLGKAAESLERSLGTHLLLKPGPRAADKKKQLTAFASYAYLERIAMEEYVGGGRPSDVALLKKELAKAKASGKKQAAAAKRKAAAQGEPFVTPPSMDGMVTSIGTGARPSTLRAKGVTADSWYAAATAKFDAYRAIEKQLTADAVQETEQISADAERDTIVNSVIVVAALLLAFVIAAMMARSMSRSMRSLRTAAFDVAEQRLPSLVDQLSRTDPGRVDTRVAPMPIESRDEIGEVARAFDQVHREAVRLAAEQALLRGNVNAIFTNLSRRNQGLIERQLGLITDLENNEADPDQLESLFRLDHLATRMRRNGENLLVLAGEEPGRRWNQPVPLIDVLRAAASEVEHYARIEISGVPESEIHGQVVNDLVHLLAELLENATSFSSPQSKVHVTATRLPDGRVMTEIHDKGIGLTAEDFADINHKLANPPTVDASVSQRMGLYVVGRLADRHGIRVQLRPSGEQAGTTSLVMLPEAITHGGGGEEQVEEQFTVSRIMPVQPETAGRGDAEPEVPDDPSSLDPVGRSLLREERRAALEGQQPPAPGAPAQQLPAAPAYETSAYETPAYETPAYGTAYEPSPPETPSAPSVPSLPEVPSPAYETPGYEPYAPYDSTSHEASQPGHSPEAEAATGVHADTQDRVGFDRPGPSPSSYRSTTGAGLPRREPGRPQQEEDPEAQHPQQEAEAESPAEWRSANDERWSRAGRLREPQAGGVTSSGLPVRVPKANLVEGTAEQTPRGGPMVSRAPEDVRGRLSNLHRGVRRGRTAGDAPQNDRQGFGPGSTYDQER